MGIKGINTRDGILKLFSMFLFLFYSNFVLAVELSDIRIYSLLNAPLDAEFTISSVNGIPLDDTLVSIAERDFYNKAGLEPLSWIYKIKFKIIKEPGSANTLVKLSTIDPVKDPYVDLYVVVNWPGGKIVREYTVLLDPPKIAVPSSRGVEPRQIGIKRPINKSLQANAPSRSKSEMRPIEPGGSYGPIIDETLWGIAKRLVENTPYSVYQGIAAIAQKNPSAFKYGNINLFSEGTTLQLPTLNEISSLSKQEAQHFVEAQNQDWQQGNYKTSQPTLPPAEDFNRQPLRLVVPGAETAINNQPIKHPMMVNEEIDTLKRSNESLSSLVSQREQEIQKLKEIIAKNQGLAIPHYSEEFAVAIPDVKKPVPQEELSISPPAKVNNEINLPPVVQSKSSPTVKVETGAPKQEPVKTRARASTIKATIFWLIVLFTLVFVSSIGFWAGRSQILAAFEKWKNKFYPAAFENEEKSKPESPILETLREHIHFDLEKALTVLSQEEKRYLNIQSNKDSKPSEEISIEDVDVYIAYERYAQAEKILQDMLNKKPEHWEALLKLLELYVLTENYQDFERVYATVPSDLNDQAPRIWSRIELLKSRVENEKAIKIGEVHTPHKDLSKESPASNFDLTKKYALSLEETELPTSFQEPNTELQNLLPEVSSELSVVKTEPTIDTDSAEDDNEIQSHITLAKAYIDIGDYDSAREFLMKAMSGGSSKQKKQVQDLLSRISKNL